MAQHHPEILVIGAGPGGSAAAWALAQAGHDVLMVDWAEFPRDKTCGDGLTPMAIGVMRQMGVLARVEAAGATRINNVSITGPYGGLIEIAFDDCMGPGTYALTLPRLHFDEIMRQHAVEGGAGYMGRVRVESFAREGKRVVAVRGRGPSGPVEFRPRYVVIAVGANMGLLRREGFLHHNPALVWASRAYYRDVHTVAGRYAFFFDRELMPGYGWIFPTGNGVANVGVGRKPTFWAKSQPTRNLLESFVRRRAEEGVMAGAERIGPVKGYPLRVDFSTQRVAGENWLLVGEAAGLVNPVTGEGIDLAMESGLMAGEALHKASQKDRRSLIAYQHRLRARFLPQFAGLHFLREILVTPVFMDYVLWLMNQHRFLAKTVINIAQGIKSPITILHPLFVAQFFMPLSPRFVWEQMAARTGNQRSQS